VRFMPRPAGTNNRDPCYDSSFVSPFTLGLKWVRRQQMSSYFCSMDESFFSSSFLRDEGFHGRELNFQRSSQVTKDDRC
jgi:hypothetical protein